MLRANDRLASLLASKTKCHVDSAESRFPTFETLCIHSIRSQALVACRIGVGELVAMGADSPQKLRLLGFDAIDLLENEFLGNVVARFGIEEVRASFVTTPGDCVAVAGSNAQQTLGISFVYLLRRCKGCPVHAKAVTEQVLRLHHMRAQTTASLIRFASPLAENGAARALLDAQVSLAQCHGVEGHMWLDLDTHGLSLDQRCRIGLPVLRLGKI